MAQPTYNAWLHRFAVFTAASTLALIGVGGLVTSHGAGMSVPDWPTSYGFNMFALPFEFWKGGAFHEHTHRLVASVVGLLTAILALWLWVRETSGNVRRKGVFTIAGVLLAVGGMMGVRENWMFLLIASVSFGGMLFGIFKARQSIGLRWLGIIALWAVVLQGVMGGLRVVLFKDELGIFHATLAQLFLVLVSVIALMTSKHWLHLLENSSRVCISRGMRRLLFAVTVLIFVQLILGATMRHQHAGLAIPDFPLAYGKIWPPTDAESVLAMNQARLDVRDPNPITAFHIVVHMMHRLTAFVILLGVIFCVWKVRQVPKSGLGRLSMVWLGMMLVQVVLGILTVLMNKPADVATGHVVVGAGSLVIGSLLYLEARKISIEGENRMRHVHDASATQPVNFVKSE